jgi:hypothetical protein
LHKLALSLTISSHIAPDFNSSQQPTEEAETVPICFIDKTIPNRIITFFVISFALFDIEALEFGCSAWFIKYGFAITEVVNIKI